MTERLDQNFAVFNNHINNASDRADLEFIRQFGQKKFDRVIKPLHENGIMTIFHGGVTPLRLAWVTMVTAFVNEGNGRRRNRKGGPNQRGQGIKTKEYQSEDRYDPANYVPS